MYDAIVIGSGIGSLTTAGLLAQTTGLRVLILEKQAHPKRGWVAGVARRSRGRRRGLHMMGVLTLPIRKTTTCPTVPSPRPI